MRTELSIVLLSILIAPAVAGDEIAYPETHRVDQVDNYHGIEIADPYRWLEKLDAEETHNWMEAQEGLLSSFLDGASVEKLAERIEQYGETGTQYSAPQYAGGRYFYTAREQQQSHSVVFARDGREGEPATILDPNAFLAEDQRFGGFSVSPGGRYLAYRVTESGSRWGDLKFLDLRTGKRLDESLGGVSSAATFWKKDESGFFYVDYGDGARLRAGEAEARAEVRFHRPGSDHADDPVVYSKPEQPSWVFLPTVSKDGRHLVLGVYEGTSERNRVMVADLESEDFEFVDLLGHADHSFTFIGSRSDTLYFYTNQGAANGRVVAIDAHGDRRGRLREVVPGGREVLAGGSSAGGNAMALVGERLVLLYRRANVAMLRVHGLDGHLEHEVPLAAGWIGSGLVGDDAVAEVWYTFNGFVEPSTVYRLDLETGKRERAFDRRLPIEPEDYVLEHVFYKSADGTEVPLFVAHKRGLRRDGKNPVFMYGYGFGGWVATPWYQPHMLAWLEMGGIYALPGIRGGGEYGDAWRDAGVRRNRQNAIDDFIAAAEWLVERRFTSAGKVVANGWSASGSLAAAAVLQRPELFGAGLIGIPSLDMLRYHHFTTIRGWTGGYGSPDDPEDFRALHDYSPYHNIQQGRCYPPILVTVGENDEVTPPLHGYKFVAALQHGRECDQPTMLKIVRGTGHSFGSTSEQSRRTYAEELTFLRQVLSKP